MSRCECALKTDRDGAKDCGAMSPTGNSCTRPVGHEGAHAACNVAEHPAETWEAER